MAEYAKAASELKARLDAKAKRKQDLDDFFEELKTCLAEEVKKANAELKTVGAPSVDFQQASVGEPTIELRCRAANCKISQDRSAPSIAAIVKGESGEKSVTFLILPDESPLQAQRVSLAPASEPRIGPPEIAAILVEELIAGAP